MSKPNSLEDYTEKKTPRSGCSSLSINENDNYALYFEGISGRLSSRNSHTSSGKHEDWINL